MYVVFYVKTDNSQADADAESRRRIMQLMPQCDPRAHVCPTLSDVQTTTSTHSMREFPITTHICSRRSAVGKCAGTSDAECSLNGRCEVTTLIWVVLLWSLPVTESVPALSRGFDRNRCAWWTRYSEGFELLTRQGATAVNKSKRVWRGITTEAC